MFVFEFTYKEDQLQDMLPNTFHELAIYVVFSTIFLCRHSVCLFILYFCGQADHRLSLAPADASQQGGWRFDSKVASDLLDWLLNWFIYRTFKPPISYFRQVVPGICIPLTLHTHTHSRLSAVCCDKGTQNVKPSHTKKRTSNSAFYRPTRHITLKPLAKLNEIIYLCF